MASSTKNTLADLFDAIENKNASSITNILTANSKLISDKDIGGNNVFHKAFGLGYGVGYGDVISALVNSADHQTIANILNQRNGDFNYPVELLDHDSSSLTLVIKALNATTDPFKKKALLSAKNNQGQTLLHLLVQEDSYSDSLVDLISEVYTDQLNAQDIAGNTPIHDMVISSQDKVLNQTLFSPSINDTYGYSLLAKHNNEKKSSFVLSYQAKSLNTTKVIVDYTNATGLAHLFNQKIGSGNEKASVGFFNLETAYEFIKATLANIVARFDSQGLYTFLNTTGIIRNVMVNKLYNLTDFSEGVYGKIGAEKMHVLMSAEAPNSGYDFLKNNVNQTNFNSEIMYGIKTYLLNITNPFNSTTDVTQAILSWNATQVEVAKSALVNAIIPYNPADSRFSSYFAIEEALEGRMSDITAEERVREQAHRQEASKVLTSFCVAYEHLGFVTHVSKFLPTINSTTGTPFQLISICNNDALKESYLREDTSPDIRGGNLIKISAAALSGLNLTYSIKQHLGVAPDTNCSIEFSKNPMPGKKALKAGALCNVGSKEALIKHQEYAKCLIGEGMDIFNSTGDGDAGKFMDLVSEECGIFNDSNLPKQALNTYCYNNGTVNENAANSVYNAVLGANQDLLVHYTIGS